MKPVYVGLEIEGIKTKLYCIVVKPDVVQSKWTSKSSVKENVEMSFLQIHFSYPQQRKHLTVWFSRAFYHFCVKKSIKFDF